VPTLGPYQLTERLGRGGMGEVWSGFRVDTADPVAVKVMTAMATRHGPYGRAFRQEVRAVAALTHPAIVRVYDQGEVPAEASSVGELATGSPYLVMELAELGTLDRLRGRMAWDALQAVLLQLLGALAHAHARHVLHRDLKPDNVLLTPRGGGLRLTDFGLAQPMDLARSGAAEALQAGTPAYMAPEQIRADWRAWGPWTDLYALGCLGWSMATGRAPHRRSGRPATLLAQLHDEPGDFQSSAGVPPGFEPWLRRLLRKDPGHRFACAADAAWALRRLGEPVGVTRVLLSSEEGDETSLLTLDAAGLWSDSGQVVEPEADGPPMPLRWRRAERSAPAELGLFGLRDLPVVGRVAERDQLWSALHRVRATGKLEVVCLRGASGVGKSRLARWLCEHAAELGAGTPLVALHGPTGGPIDGLGAMISRRLVCQGLPRAAVLARIERWLSPVAAQVPPDEAEALTELIVPATDAERGGGLRAVRFRSAGERAVLLERFLGRLGQERPVVVWLDDAQWGLESLELARLLWQRRELGACRALLVLTVREEAVEQEARELLDELGTTLRLGPLPAADHEALVQMLLGLEPELSLRVRERTDGNPLFAVQLLHDWVRRGVLSPGTGGLRLVPGAVADLPDDLHGMWSSRLDRLALSGVARRALELAATLGQDVQAEEWGRACGEAQLPFPSALVERLLHEALFVQREEGWSFVHGMLRESVVRGAREAGRHAEHARVCAALLAGSDALGDSERRARYLLAAGEDRDALAPLVRAARQRFELGDHRRALALLTDREQAVERLGLAPDDALRAEAWHHRVALLSVLEGAKAAEDALRGFEAQAGVRGWDVVQLRLVAARAALARQAGDLRLARDLYARAERGFAARELPADAARSAAELGHALVALGALDEARTVGSRAVAAASEPYRKADALLVLAVAARAAGRADAAGEHAEAVLELGERWGFRKLVAAAELVRGEVARNRGDWELAALAYEAAASAYRALGTPEVFVAEVDLALVDVQAGRLERARQRAQALLISPQLAQFGIYEAVLKLVLVCCCGAEADWEGFEVHLMDLMPGLHDSGFVDPDVARLAYVAGMQARDGGEVGHAHAAFQLARAQWAALGRVEEAAAVWTVIELLP